MLNQGSKLYSILNYKCPRCHKGDLFTHKGWSYTKFGDMPEECPCCHQRYQPEPGFYYGAMYVSYGITTAITVTILVALSIILEEVTLYWFIGALVGTLLLFYPFIFRMSRAIWINFFVRYNKDVAASTSC
ncbi:DUF983 domain-containing protein [Pontibacter anaerobius]|uniref:DUF983 domain-containing protein n=1 Tax=Pontibacter anaerobius TaxID=2993940 RepID=A0ABT3RF11_9BACT|nr:DUF983 domain-containing protein [Pontibacter anaerobius]MCX2739825.1 DUF983 domain-containing protein [Pontibacter anaerobius]